MKILKIPADVAGILIISLFLFIIRAGISHRVTPEIIFSNDYYVQIELGKNIFQKGNFLATSQAGLPLQYPPLFSVVIYLLTAFTKNPLLSIQYINAFSASFCLIPFYLIIKAVINKFSAFLGVLWLTLYLGITDPCFFPFIDYFYMLLVVSAFGLILSIYKAENPKPYLFVLTGIMVALNYLTRFLGLYFGFIALGAIIRKYVLKKEAGAKLFKISALFLIGALPLIIFYQGAFHFTRAGRGYYDIGHYSYIDGNYSYQGGREHKLYALNPEGNEFLFLSDYAGHTLIKDGLRHPDFILDKYKSGLKTVLFLAAQSLFPFTLFNQKIFYIGFWGIFVAVLFALFFFRPNKEPPVILAALFALPMALLPFYVITRRYLVPFIPFYMILCLFIFYGIFSLILKKKETIIIRYFLAAACLFLAAGVFWRYWENSADKTSRFIRYQNEFVEGYQDASRWIAGDAGRKTTRPKVMSRKTVFAQLADADYIVLPYENEWGRVIRFAELKSVDYIVLDKLSVQKNRPDQWEALTQQQPPGLELVYDSKTAINTIQIYKLIE